MAFDVEKWLLEEMGFTADEIKDQGLVSKFSGRADKLEKGYLRQQDLSRQMDALRTQKDDLDKRDSKLNEEFAEFATMTAGEREKYQKAVADADELRTKVFDTEQKLIRVATEAGIDPATLVKQPAKEPVKEPTAVDLDPLRNQIGGVASFMLTLTAKLPRIAREHKALTGQDFDEDKFVTELQADIASGNKKAEFDPVKRWEAQNDIPTKRAAAATADMDRRIAEAREEGRTAARSEAALPGGSPRPGEHSPVFKTTNVTSGSVLKRPQPGDRTAGAVAALATGRYRTQPAQPKT